MYAYIFVIISTYIHIPSLNIYIVVISILRSYKHASLKIQIYDPNFWQSTIFPICHCCFLVSCLLLVLSKYIKTYFGILCLLRVLFFPSDDWKATAFSKTISTIKGTIAVTVYSNDY